MVAMNTFYAALSKFIFVRLRIKSVYLLGILGTLFLLPLSLFLAAHFWPLDTQAAIRSQVVLDRHGQLLRAFATPQGRWRLPVSHSDVDTRYLAMLKAFEDRRFDSHIGVDPYAVGRAFRQAVSHGRIVSGASTLTMQVARLLEPRSSRSTGAKLWQMARALSLETRSSKTQVLDHYLALAPFGGNIEGVRAASLAYFGKEPRRLSVGEAALLVALPQSPETRRPDRASEETLRRVRNRVMERAVVAGIITPEDLRRAQEEPIPRQRLAFPMIAPHTAFAQSRANPEAQQVQLTIDKAMQVQLEALVKERSLTLGTHLSVAMMVIAHGDGSIRASIGGVKYLDAERAGALDLTKAERSPGSALKPFIYALAFEQGLAHPETQLEDRPTRYGAYAPENFDLSFQGLVSARKALQYSLNVPAVDLLAALTPQRFLSRLKGAGAHLVMPPENSPGLAVGLGGLGITLHDLAGLYTGLARGGVTTPLYVQSNAVPSADQFLRLTDPVSAWYISDILKGAPPPPHAPFGRIAFKTGTSYGYRDAWAVGYDRRYVVAVWVGRADGAPVVGLTGRGSAAPFVFDAFARIGIDPEPFAQPSGALVSTHKALPAPLRHIRQDVAKTQVLTTSALKIAFPPHGARLDLSSSGGGKRDDHNTALPDILLKANGGTPPFLWLMNGRPVISGQTSRTASWKPEGLGFVDISIIDAKGVSDSVKVRLE
jgi:penicillin-binding protein 1C